MFEVAGITLAKNLDGRLELLANVTRGGLPDAVWRRWELLEGGWAAWQSLGKPGGGAAFTPAVAQNHDGRLEAAIVCQDQEVRHAWQRHPGRDWTGWQAMKTPGEQIRFWKRPAFVRNQDGRLELFARAEDGAVWHRWQTRPGHGPWSPWSTLGTPGDYGADEVAAVRNQDGRLELFVLDENASTSHRWQTKPGGDQWSAWSALGRPGEMGLIFAPAVARNQDGRLELLMCADTYDEGVWQRRQGTASHGTWSTWSALGRPAGVYTRIAVGAHADGRLVLAAGRQMPPGTPASQLEPVSLLEQTAPGGDWSPWRSIPSPGPSETTDPALALDAGRRLQVWLPIPGTIDLFQLRQKRPNGGEWEGIWRSPAEPPDDPPH